jgi:hypothetical protein
MILNFDNITEASLTLIAELMEHPGTVIAVDTEATGLNVASQKTSVSASASPP